MKKKLIYYFFVFAVLGVFVSGCSDFLETNPDNRLTLEDVKSSPRIAEGWLLRAYQLLPTDYEFLEDFASDDAVTNDRTSNKPASVIDMNNGGWTSSNNPLAQWNTSYEAILYLNTFLEHVDEIEWSWESAERDSLFRERLKGEAYGLRAWWNFKLLQAHAGLTGNDVLLGVPLVTEVLTINDDYKLPRVSFDDFVKAVDDDCNEAIKRLPNRYDDGNEGSAEYKRVMGSRYANRLTALATKLLKSKVALYAASPAYNISNDISKWETAAQYAADLMKDNGGISNLTGSEIEFYLDYMSSDILWASTTNDNTTKWEKSNFPPTLYGDGNVNPSQNLVDAFPMANGYPISNASANYDAKNPYANRDPRLAAYVLYNGATFGSSTINTHNGNDNGIGKTVKSTRTGYYLKKFLNPNVKVNPSAPFVGTTHFYTYARYTEALLNFAEAANEAVGPDANIEGYSAREVIKSIRARAGVDNAYVDGISGKDAFRELIQNERRIELCFEGNRFWDIRRWKLTDVMKLGIKGININSDQTELSVINVENRNYSEYQIYGPIPFDETLKYDIDQNKGW